LSDQDQPTGIRDPGKDPSIPGHGLLRRLRLAGLALAWEGLWQSLWPIPALCALFAALALLDLLPLLPFWLHMLVLAAFPLSIGACLLRLRRYHPPDLRRQAARLERDNGLAHQPVQRVLDDLAAGRSDPVARALWEENRRRLSGLLSRLTLRWPSPQIAAQDPWGLRFAALLLLAIGLAVGWRDASGRFARALQPALTGTPAATLQVWLTPPAFTGQAPLALTAGTPVAPQPAGTTLFALAQGADGPVRLTIDGEDHPFQSKGDDTQSLDLPLAGSGHLEVRQGRHALASWDIVLVPQTAPAVAFAAPPERDAEGRLLLDLVASDDWGLRRAFATIRPANRSDAAPLVLDLPLPPPHPGQTRQSSWHDLTAHPLAGMAVTLQPGAESVAGLTAVGQPLTMVLPERVFRHPVARAVAAQRHQLLTDPASRREVAVQIAALADNPVAYGGDIKVFLELSTSVSRLVRDRSDDAIASVADILWQTALAIDEGDTPDARRAVDDAAAALEKALAQGASQAEIAQLSQALRDAMDRFMEALARQAARQGTPLTTAPSGLDTVSPEDLGKMLDQIGGLSATGATDAARELLSDMRRILDGLRLPDAADAERARQAGQAMADLDDIARGQRQLLDETFHRSQSQDSGRQPQRHAPDAALSARQDRLRERLGKVQAAIQGLGAAVPEALQQADGAMADAGQALKAGRIDDAVDAQTEALNRLQQGMTAAGQSLARQLGPGVYGQGGNDGRDPLGRPFGHGTGANDDHSVTIPTQADQQKARDVLTELRRRASQVERPAPERNYLQRLLKQFF
jgi:hypothetical protein